MPFNLSTKGLRPLYSSALKSHFDKCLTLYYNGDWQITHIGKGGMFT